MRRKPLYYRIAPLTPSRCRAVVLCGISSRFQLLSPCNRQVAHALLTRPPLAKLSALNELLLIHLVPTTSPVRLACLKHAASVRPEPGSNSKIKFYTHRVLFHFSLVSLYLLAFVVLE